jgi:beta-galactosidase
VGVRSVRWDAINGAFINEQRVKLRGFCNHNNFAGLGMAVPTRVNLLRLQQIRGMGGNSWRMSHNPGNPDTFLLGDRLGMTFLDENRVFKDDDASVENMRDMVRRDRVHPSILY